MERIFINALKRQLSQRVKGDISVHIVNDILIVEIDLVGYCGWCYAINNLAAQMSTGLSSKIVSDVIVKRYKKYILKQYFR